MSAAADSAETTHLFGLMRIGATVLALPVAALREVIGCPPVLAPLPMTALGLRGAVRLRGTVIPVLDLRPALGMPVEDAAAPVIVVMRWAGRLLGLWADGVCGMALVADEKLHCLTVSDAAATASPVTHSFEIDDGIASLLGAERVAALPGVPMVAEPAALSSGRHGGQREPVLLFRTGALSFGIPAMSVDATVPRCMLRGNALTNALCRGVIDHHGHEVPVVDTLALLGLGAAPAGAMESAVLVLRFGDGRIGLMLDEVRDIARITAADIVPLPALLVQRAGMFRGVLVGDGTEQLLLLDAQALQADPILQALASMSRPKAAKAAPSGSGGTGGTGGKGGAGAGGGVAAGPSYLTYEIGVETASPLVQVSEILPYPTYATPLQTGRVAVLGLFSHRGVAVPLVCLCSLLGRPAPTTLSDVRVLLVPEGGDIVGFVVPALRSIEVARWEQPAGAAAPEATLDGVQRYQPLVEVGTDALRRTLPRLDLRLLARALRLESGIADVGVAAHGETAVSV